jgi:hypothetical protein
MNGKLSQDFFSFKPSFIRTLSFAPSQLSCNRLRSLINQLKQSGCGDAEAVQFASHVLSSTKTLYFHIISQSST